MVNKINIKKQKGIAWRMIAFPLIMIYLEYYFRMEIYQGVSSGGIYPFAFAIATGFLLAVLTCIFQNTGNCIIAFLSVSVLTILYLSQIIYYRIFGTFYGLSSLKAAGDAMAFKDEVFLTLKGNIVCVLGMLIPIVCLIIFSTLFLSYERPEGKKTLVSVIVFLMTLIGSVSSLNIGGREMLSPYNLFHENFVMSLSMRKLGIIVTTGRDLQVKITGGSNMPKQEFNPDYTTLEDIDENGYEPQIDPVLDFQKIYDTTTDEDIRSITAYVSNREPTYKNEYSGMYEGYNLIFINAESLSPFAVREDWMPMLYRMMHEGFVFTNYYQPTWNKSTIDGEYTNCLSQYPAPNRWSLYESSDTYQPYALGNALTAKGYTCKAYHDYDFNYYDRSKTHPNLGYDFKAVGFGLNLPSEEKYFSDLEMMQVAYDEFVSAEPFHAYFMTYSGHLPYDYKTNPIAEKNRARAEKLTEGLGYNDTVKAYVAAQLEFEYALEYLVERLGEDNLLDRTLFVISPDHYPYAFQNDDYDILAQKSVLNNEFTTYQSCLAIWNSQMDEMVTVDKICSGVDILPTVLNLMGVTYDSRLLAGRDILYNQEGYVVVEDYSYLTPYIEYDAKKDKVSERNEDVTEYQKTSVMDLNKLEQMYKISEKILIKDYFGYIYQKNEKK